MSKLLNMLAASDDTDEVVISLHCGRDLLMQATRDYAEEALAASQIALDGAQDGDLCAELYALIQNARTRRDKALEGLKGVAMLTDLICNAQATGNDDADEAFTEYQVDTLRAEVVLALVEGVDKRVSAVLALLPDNPVPGARCTPAKATESDQ